MNKLKQYTGKLGTKLGIPAEIALDESRIVAIGHNQVRVENHKGIIEYSETCVRLRVVGGCLRMEGEQLIIDEYNSERICISGIIKQITLP